MEYIHVHRDATFIKTLEDTLESGGPFSTWEQFKLVYQAESSTLTPTFKGLRALSYLPHMKFLEHQIQTAEKAIEEMNGRAILADEVGLGKTIEAGLILKEYMIRGLVTKALILVPASLVNQWVKELNEKFYIPAIAYRKNYAWDQYDIVVSSIDTAKRAEHQEDILKLDYDFILVDEAHQLKNNKTINYSFVQSLQKRYCLLLTATPIQNNLVEIFNLVSILKPGHLGNYQSFLERFGKDRKMITQDIYLKQLIKKVMIRNTRRETSLNNVKRKISTVWLDFTHEELSVYKDIEKLANDVSTFSRITFLRELCSSREACFLSLKKTLTHENTVHLIEPIIKKIEQLPHHTKAHQVVEIIQKIGNEKMIIFTEYRATQHYLQWYLQQYGITSVPFRGGFKSGKKEWMKQLFKDHAQVLIATAAGAEGINLQFCKYLINYDLPWNPMKLEQRIGRIHRYGQENDVQIYNFAIRQTIEEHIMTLLYEKIQLFEQVVGDLDEILAELHLTNFEKEMENIFSESTSIGETKIKLKNLSSAINHMNEKKNG